MHQQALLLPCRSSGGASLADRPVLNRLKTSTPPATTPKLAPAPPAGPSSAAQFASLLDLLSGPSEPAARAACALPLQNQLPGPSKVAGDDPVASLRQEHARSQQPRAKSQEQRATRCATNPQQAGVSTPAADPALAPGRSSGRANPSSAGPAVPSSQDSALTFSTHELGAASKQQDAAPKLLLRSDSRPQKRRRIAPEPITAIVTATATRYPAARLSAQDSAPEQDSAIQSQTAQRWSHRLSAAVDLSHGGTGDRAGPSVRDEIGGPACVAEAGKDDGASGHPDARGGKMELLGESEGPAITGLQGRVGLRARAMELSCEEADAVWEEFIADKEQTFGMLQVCLCIGWP